MRVIREHRPAGLCSLFFSLGYSPASNLLAHRRGYVQDSICERAEPGSHQCWPRRRRRPEFAPRRAATFSGRNVTRSQVDQCGTLQCQRRSRQRPRNAPRGRHEGFSGRNGINLQVSAGPRQRPLERPQDAARRNRNRRGRNHPPGGTHRGSRRVAAAPPDPATPTRRDNKTLILLTHWSTKFLVLLRAGTAAACGGRRAPSAGRSGAHPWGVLRHPPWVTCDM